MQITKKETKMNEVPHDVINSVIEELLESDDPADWVKGLNMCDR